MKTSLKAAIGIVCALIGFLQINTATSLGIINGTQYGLRCIIRYQGKECGRTLVHAKSAVQWYPGEGSVCAGKSGLDVYSSKYALWRGEARCMNTPLNGAFAHFYLDSRALLRCQIDTSNK